ncbi:hypothetical protein [endosymbiont GvMRE of Glomus versiforme]|uniref:hypothetical protein n=1 Tax=endosymbiont GvMRE of Glomus versiforme TaxID=2039283 RepID=UPI000ECDC03D|nr:hypothetical protein [endosymbiont GvMRE of Glomus versiforme]RHZ37618.1 hypothetical protein GvMRE_I1g35 [endosymbiont GvMRE of Glomus versiforme]
MKSKRWNKITCGNCHKLHDADNLIPDLKNNRYLCDSCYEPRENINEEKKDWQNDEENISKENNKYQKGELRFKRGL